MRISTSPDYDSLSDAVAGHIADFAKANPGALFCFAAGDTPLGTLRRLVALQSANRVDLKSMYYVGLDEWIGLGYEDRGSCKQIMQDNFYGPAGIPADHMLVFDGLDGDLVGQAGRHLDFIARRGGIALTMLGLGMNGHLGFNEPGTSPEFEGGIVDLDATTREVGKKYFRKAYALERGITVGLKTLRAAREVLLVASGEKKAEIVRAACAGKLTPDIPASLIMDHPHLELFLDRGAASRLPDSIA